MAKTCTRTNPNVALAIVHMPIWIANLLFKSANLFLREKKLKKYCRHNYVSAHSISPFIWFIRTVSNGLDLFACLNDYSMLHSAIICTIDTRLVLPYFLSQSILPFRCDFLFQKWTYFFKKSEEASLENLLKFLEKQK